MNLFEKLITRVFYKLGYEPISPEKKKEFFLANAKYDVHFPETRPTPLIGEIVGVNCEYIGDLSEHPQRWRDKINQWKLNKNSSIAELNEKNTKDYFSEKGRLPL